MVECDIPIGRHVQRQFANFVVAEKPVLPGVRALKPAAGLNRSPDFVVVGVGQDESSAVERNTEHSFFGLGAELEQISDRRLDAQRLVNGRRCWAEKEANKCLG